MTAEKKDKKEARRKGAFAEAFERGTQVNGEGMKGSMELPRHRGTFTIDHAICSPGSFDEDFELTIQALSAGEEMKACKGAEGDATTLAFSMAKAAICAFNEERLSSIKVEWLWERLGPAGRQLVTAMFAQIGMADPESMGKASASLRVH